MEMCDKTSKTQTKGTPPGNSPPIGQSDGEILLDVSGMMRSREDS